jgi:hypothetical protein
MTKQGMLQIGGTRQRHRQSDDSSSVDPTSALTGASILNGHAATMKEMVGVLQSMAATRTHSTKATAVAQARASLASASTSVENAEKTFFL